MLKSKIGLKILVSIIIYLEKSSIQINHALRIFNPFKSYRPLPNFCTPNPISDFNIKSIYTSGKTWNFMYGPPAAAEGEPV